MKTFKSHLLNERWIETIDNKGNKYFSDSVMLYKNPSPKEMTEVRNSQYGDGVGIIENKNTFYTWNNTAYFHDYVRENSKTNIKSKYDVRFMFSKTQKSKIDFFELPGKIMSDSDKFELFYAILSCKPLQSLVENPKDFDKTYLGMYLGNYTEDARKLHAKKYRISITENWVTAFKMRGHSKNFAILKNPNRKEMLEIRGNYGDGAGIVTKKDWYAFSGNAFHHDAETAIKKVEKLPTKDLILTRFMINTNGTIEALGPDGGAINYQASHNILKRKLAQIEREMKTLQSHPTLSRVISGNNDESAYADYIDAIDEIKSNLNESTQT